MAKKVAKKKVVGNMDSKVSALRDAEKVYLANLKLCRNAISNSVLEQYAINQAVKVFEERVKEILK